VISAAIPIEFRPHFYQTAWFYALSTLLLLTMVASAFLLHRRRLHQRFEAVLTERNRLAREMHDTLIQGCIGVSTLLEAAQNTAQSFPDKSRLLVERATVQNKETIDEARYAVWDLRRDKRPAEFPFGYILTSLVTELRDEEAPPISLQMPELLPVLGMDVGESLLHVVREAMLNAIRHADARHIELRTRVARRVLTIVVIDDGRGFAIQPNHPLHYGITGMRERVLSLGGRFSLTSKPGKGTTVQIELPFKRRIVERGNTAS
jgi:signal transduction histidine kinase